MCDKDVGDFVKNYNILQGKVKDLNDCNLSSVSPSQSSSKIYSRCNVNS